MPNVTKWRREVDDVAREVNTTGASHLKITHPDGWFVFVSSTPGDRRSRANLRADVRRRAAGVRR